jgi:hypothetical protein
MMFFNGILDKLSNRFLVPYAAAESNLWDAHVKKTPALRAVELGARLGAGPCFVVAMMVDAT